MTLPPCSCIAVLKALSLVRGSYVEYVFVACCWSGGT